MRIGLVAGLIALSLGTGAQAAPLAVIDPGVGDSSIRQVASVSSDTVFYVQQQLAAQGYAVGPVDGVAGSRTRAAVRAYEADHGLPVTGNAYALADQLSGASRTATTTQQRVIVTQRPVVIPPLPPYYRRHAGPRVGLYIGPHIGFGLRHWRGGWSGPRR